MLWLAAVLTILTCLAVPAVLAVFCGGEPDNATRHDQDPEDWSSGH